MNTESVWEEYREALQAFLHSRVSTPDDVDDLLQEILIKTHKNLHTIKSGNSIKSWLFQIANHTIIDFYRKQQSTVKQVTADDLWFAEENTSIQQSLAQCIEPFINALPEESAKLLTAIELQGYSQKAYADKQGISYSTLKSRVQQSRRKLRQLFEDCCHLTLDHRGTVIDFDPKPNNCKNC